MAISLGILCVLALAATGISLFALLCARALATDVCGWVSDLEGTIQSALRATEAKLAELAAEARDRVVREYGADEGAHQTLARLAEYLTAM